MEVVERLFDAPVESAKRHAKQPVVMKLSPNVTDITEMARAAQMRSR